MNRRASLRRYGLVLSAAVVAVLLLATLLLAGDAGAVNGYQNGLADHAAGPSANPFPESVDSTPACRPRVPIAASQSEAADASRSWSEEMVSWSEEMVWGAARQVNVHPGANPGIAALPDSLRTQTEICGAITDTHWTLSGSPYVITCNASLNSGTLLIDPGVSVRFQSGTRMDVSATLLAEGTKDTPIVFTSNKSTPARGDWSGLYFRAGSSNSVLRHVIVEYGTGISVQNASPLIDRATIRYNASSGIYLYNSRSTISHSTIFSNTASSGAGVHIRYGRVTLDSNTISWNKATTRGGGVHGYGWTCCATITVTNNVIVHNSVESYGGGGILFDSANGLIANNTIADNSTGAGSGGGLNISGASGPRVTLQNNVIVRNSAAYVGGVTTDAYTTITGNLIANNASDNAEGGLYYEYPSGWHGPSAIPVTCNTIVNNTGPAERGNGVRTTVLSPFHRNTIYGNSGYQFARGTGRDVDATENYWGTTDTEQIANGIYDDSDDPNLGVVSFSPFLSAADTCAPLPDGGYVSGPAADPHSSTIDVQPTSLPADGMTTATITVQLLSADGQPAWGKTVRLESSRGGDDLIQQPQAPTDANGQAVATVQSLTSGTATLSAWDLTDGFQILQTVTVTFTEVAPVPQVILQKADEATRRALWSVDRIQEDATAVIDEAVYFRGAIGERSIRFAASFLDGLLNVWEGASALGNAEKAAQMAFPGWKTWLGSSAWASEVACQISNDFIRNATDQQLVRLVLRAGLYYLVAQQKNRRLRDLQFDLLADSAVISNLLLAHLERPAAEWPVRKAADRSRTLLQTSQDRLVAVRLSPLTQAEQQAYVDDLGLRARALSHFVDRVRRARWTLESVHQAHEADPAGGHWLQMALRLGARGLAFWVFDGPGERIVHGGLAFFDAYMNGKATQESYLMFDLATGTLTKTAPEALSSAANSIATGLKLIADRELPVVPQGRILNVRHVVEVSGWGPLAKVQQAYSDIRIKNTGSTRATFHVWAAYDARTTRLSVPWATLSLTQPGTPVELGKGEETTVRIVYLDGNRGYRPADRYSLPFGIGGEVSPSYITVDLLGINDKGIFFLDHDWSPWMPERQPAGGGAVTLASLDQDVPLVDTPLVSFVLGGNRPLELQGRLWVNNPFTITVPVTVTQPLPAEITVLDPGRGWVQDDDIVWTDSF